MSTTAPTTAVIIVDHGSRRPESNAMLEEVAKAFSSRFSGEFAIVEPAHMELCMPDIAAAYDRCVARGARHITLLPFFLAKGKHWTKDIPSLVSQAAAKHAGTTYAIAEPLGIDDLILDLLFKRATTHDEPTIKAGQADPRLADEEPSKRRVQCATCPFQVEADGRIVIRPESGVSLHDLAGRARSAAIA